MIDVKVKQVKLTEIKLNPDNPRRISDKDMDRLVKSLQEFPDMMKLREIVVDETMTILGGNMRYLGLKKIGAKECTAKIVNGLTPEQKREFVVKDNSNFGTFDFDMLANGWDDLPLVEWGVDLPEDWLSGAAGGDQDSSTEAGDGSIEPIPFGILKRKRICNRNGVDFISFGEWGADKEGQISAVKQWKDSDVPGELHEEIARLLAGTVSALGVCPIWVTTPPCHHGKINAATIIAKFVAESLSVPFVVLFKNENKPKGRHPARHIGEKEYEKINEQPEGMALVVDDIATSGQTIAKSILSIREEGAACGIVFICDR